MRDSPGVSRHRTEVARNHPLVHRLADGLAYALLDGEWEYGAMLARADVACGRPGGWMRQLVRGALQAYPAPPRGRARELGRFLRLNPPLAQVCGRLLAGRRPLPVVRLRARAPARTAMAPAPWPVPRWDTVSDLAGHLGLTCGELSWFADAQERLRRGGNPKLAHYTYRRIPRPHGRSRLLEIPKYQLREIQRRILHELLDALPPHDAAHGFRPGRSARTFAQIHSGQKCVVRMDLESYFSSISVSRIWGVFRLAGYADPVAHVLAGLVTTRTPNDVRRDFLHSPDAAERRTGAWLGAPHLPQGGPASPALANLVTYRLDARLAGLARRLGAVYARYADDLAFSGMSRPAATALTDRVEQIVREEGFRVNADKGIVRADCARQLVTGLVVNAHPNVPRAEFDRLKAILHNAAVHGPATQNTAGHPDLRAHLLGRVAWVEHVNPAKGARLRRVFERIDWS